MPISNTNAERVTKNIYADLCAVCHGIGTPLGLAWHAGEKQLYSTQHGRDQLAQNWGFDETTSAEQPRVFAHQRRR
jgi:glucose/arabinose dehydrogenase